MNTSPPQWSDRFNRSLFDHHPHLYAAEQTEIAHLIARWKQRIFTGKEDFIHLPKDYPLYRLLQPIYQVGKLVEVSHKTQTTTTRLLVWEMHRRGTAYWGWTPAVWCEILQPNVEAFRARYNCYHYTRALLLMVSYVLCNFTDIQHLNRSSTVRLAQRVFGRSPVEESVKQVCQELIKWGYTAGRVADKVPKALCLVLLVNQSPRLKDISIELLEDIRRQPIAQEVIQHMYRISLALYQLGYITTDLRRDNKQIARQRYTCCHEGVPDQWLYWCDRWEAVSTRTERYRLQTRRLLLKVGRYLAVHDPKMTSPSNWTRDTALAVTAAVTRMKVGEWNSPAYRHPNRVIAKIGHPLSANARLFNLYR